MVSSNGHHDAAATIAKELSQSPNHPGVGRLAADLADTSDDISELEAHEAIMRIPGASYGMASVMFSGSKGYEDWSFHTSVHIGDPVVAMSEMSRKSLSDSLVKLMARVGTEARKAAREARAKAMVEKMLAEEEAADAAVKATDPLFRDDGEATTGTLPLDKYDGVPGDTGGI